jgi:hypothetical protein
MAFTAGRSGAGSCWACGLCCPVDIHCVAEGFIGGCELERWGGQAVGGGAEAVAVGYIARGGSVGVCRSLGTPW